jgi:hypothetical protein
MDIHIRNLLISLIHVDFSFDNPLELRLEADGLIVGSAELCKKKGQLFADILIEKHVDYLSMFPRLGVDVINKRIGYVFLSQQNPIDSEVKIIKEQMKKSK